MINSLEKAKALLSENDYTFALINGGKTFTSDKRGIAPILMLLDTSPELLKNAVIADKVIGKAAAMLLVYAGISQLHTVTISELAIDTLKNFDIQFSYENVVPQIKNRSGDGMCPMEASVMYVEKPEKAYEILKEMYSKMIKPHS